MDGRMDKWMGGWMDTQTQRQTQRQKGKEKHLKSVCQNINRRYPQMLEHQVVFNVSYLFNNFYNEREAFLSKKISKAIFTFEIKFLKMGKNKISRDPTHS